MDPQDALSKSYTDSISSYLYEQDDDVESVYNNSLSAHVPNQSISSNLSNFKSTGYTTPIIVIPKIMADDNSNTRQRRGSSLYSSPRHYPNSDAHSFDQYSIDNESQDDYEDDDAVTPLPKLQMLVISILLFSEPLTSTILFPFIYFMTWNKLINMHFGAAAASVFFIAQFCTAIMWGRVSDRYGRRPVLLTGLIGNTISSCMFGLSKSLWWAIGARALCGIMNGNSGVARSMVSEITDNTNKAKAFSIFGFCWGAGMIAGPALGGYLAKPVEQFPGLFGDSVFLTKYPYFLPCFVSSCGSMVGFVIGYFYLKESNPNVLADRKWKFEANERTALLRSNNNSNAMDESVAKRILPKSGSMRLVTQTSIIIIIAYSVFGFHAMVFDEVLPLYFTAPVVAGGLGITRTDFAKALSFFGVIQLIFQFGIYPRLTKYYSTLVLCRLAFLVFIPVYFLFPELSTLRDWVASNISGEASENWTFRFAYLCLMLIRYSGCCLAYTGLGIMVSTSAAPEILGTVNGICQSCLSLVRALGPTFGGTLWSLSIKDGNVFPLDRHLVYYIIGFLSIFSFLQSFYIPNSVALGGNKKR
ncbi:member of major facilitator superfamily multidrug-resistance, DHA1 sub-family [Mucor ambiguus]|uniref:Member of major facilitator superfamily multidrug-resistance, DHA1 sub-family n=1 Tax=Mucor ambiguus TaxID=91626 RepID=A0A0C9MM08_9FUNG|nr:member of major facilitator superfamily multidrug-resistance, DHA1 sub-family [Mucor ambiguus]